MHISMVFQNSIQLLNLESINERKLSPVIQLLPKPFLLAVLLCGLDIQSVTFSVHVWQKHFTSKRKPLSS